MFLICPNKNEVPPKGAQTLPLFFSILNQPVASPPQVGSEKRREDFERRLQLTEQHLEALQDSQRCWQLGFQVSQ